MGKQIFHRTEKPLSILFVAFFMASVTITVSAANCWNEKGSFDKGSLNENFNENVNSGLFNEKNNGNLKVGNQICRCGDKISPPPSMKNKFTDIAHATKS